MEENKTGSVPVTQKTGVAVRESAVSTGELTMADVDRLKRSMTAFNKLKNEILISGADKVTILGKEAITRSGFSKIALAFNLSTEIKETRRVNTADNYIVEVTARAVMASGRYAEGTAACEAKELREKGGIKPTTHNIESIASTRATNRAIANLVGGGILSKEELEAGESSPSLPNSNVFAYNTTTGTESTSAQATGDFIAPSPKQQKYLDTLLKEDIKAQEFFNQYLDEIEVQDRNGLSKKQTSDIIDKLVKKDYTLRVR